ncbi:MAG: class I SAM-dependent methyltransferase [Bacteroidia bacterium]|nr:class I SAM-dependent methyltransferase [Bacteroidia bacterium]
MSGNRNHFSLQSLRLLRTRVLWFLRNYNSIRFNSTLFQDVHGPPVYNTDGLATSNNADFISEPRFAHAYELAKKTKPWPGFTLMWRVYTCCWFAELASGLEGDFVECGVNTGAYARAIIDYTDFESLNKTFHLLDTYSGLDERFVSETEKASGILGYTYRNTYDEVVKTFRGFRVNIVKGAIPETLGKCRPELVCYLSVDMNNTLPEISALEYFWPKIVKKGIVLLDDYGFPGHEEQKKAFDTFAKKYKETIFSMPTGQGLIIKRS